MRRIVAAPILALVGFAQPLFAADPTVTNVRAQQLADRTVEVLYDLSGAPADGAAVSVSFSQDGGSSYPIVPETSALSGQFGVAIASGSNRRIVWDAAATMPASFYSTTMRAAVTAIDPNVGSGTLSFRLLWSGVEDLDLHVVEPDGTHIYYGSRYSSSGGQLDHDCTCGAGACAIPIENIYWPDSGAPAGTYSFWVHYWGPCTGGGSKSFTLYVIVNGSVTRTITGTLLEGEDSSIYTHTQGGSAVVGGATDGAPQGPGVADGDSDLRAIWAARADGGCAKAEPLSQTAGSEFPVSALNIGYSGNFTLDLRTPTNAARLVSLGSVLSPEEQKFRPGDTRYAYYALTDASGNPISGTALSYPLSFSGASPSAGAYAWSFIAAGKVALRLAGDSLNLPSPGTATLSFPSGIGRLAVDGTTYNLSTVPASLPLSRVSGPFVDEWDLFAGASAGATGCLGVCTGTGPVSVSFAAAKLSVKGSGGVGLHLELGADGHLTFERRLETSLAGEIQVPSWNLHTTAGTLSGPGMRAGLEKGNTTTQQFRYAGTGDPLSDEARMMNAACFLETASIGSFAGGPAVGLITKAIVNTLNRASGANELIAQGLHEERSGATLAGFLSPTLFTYKAPSANVSGLGDVEGISFGLSTTWKAAVATETVLVYRPSGSARDLDAIRYGFSGAPAGNSAPLPLPRQLDLGFFSFGRNLSDITEKVTLDAWSRAPREIEVGFHAQQSSGLDLGLFRSQAYDAQVARILITDPDMVQTLVNDSTTGLKALTGAAGEHLSLGDAAVSGRVEALLDRAKSIAPADSPAYTVATDRTNGYVVGASPSVSVPISVGMFTINPEIGLDLEYTHQRTVEQARTAAVTSDREWLLSESSKTARYQDSPSLSSVVTSRVLSGLGPLIREAARRLWGAFRTTLGFHAAVSGQAAEVTYDVSVQDPVTGLIAGTAHFSTAYAGYDAELVCGDPSRLESRTLGSQATGGTSQEIVWAYTTRRVSLAGDAPLDRLQARALASVGQQVLTLVGDYVELALLSGQTPVGSFGSAVSLSLPLYPDHAARMGIEPARLSGARIFRYDSSSDSWQEIGGTVGGSNASVSVPLTVPGLYAPGVITTLSSGDSDGDGLNDTDEDRNGDGIVDQGETDPYAWDTDGDGVSDGAERAAGTDPLVASSAPNRAPTLGYIGSRTVETGQTLRVDLLATDPDGDAFAFGATGLPPGAVLGASSGTLEWTPGSDGEWRVTVTVTDSHPGGQPLSDSETFLLTAQSGTTPVVADFDCVPDRPTVGQPSTCTALADPAHGSPASFSWRFSGDPISHSGLSVSHAFGCGGQQTVMLTAARGAVQNSTSRGLVVTGPDCAPESIVAPDAAKVPGLNNTFWRTDLRLFNPSATPTTSYLEILKAGADNRSAFTLGPLTLTPKSTLVVNDLLGWVATQGLNVSKAAVRVRYSNPESVAPLLMTRTYTDSVGGGTYGQSIRGRAVVQDSTSPTLWLAGVRNDGLSSGYRTNLSLVNLRATEVNGVTLKLFDAVGAERGTKVMSLPPFGYLQDSVRTLFGDGVATIGPAAVMVTLPANSDVQAYASVVENLTGDPIEVQAEPSARGEAWIPGVARIPGQVPTTWRTDLQATNVDSAPRTFRLQFIPKQAVASAAREITLGSRATLAVEDLVAWFYEPFTPPDASGIVKVTAADGLPNLPALSARTYNVTATGTFGQDVPAVVTGVGASAGGPFDELHLTGMSTEDIARSNLGFLNVGSGTVVLDVYFYDELGNLLNPPGRAYSLSLGSAGWDQDKLENRFRNTFGSSLPANLRVVSAVAVVRSGGPVYMYASVIDALTGDPVFIPARPGGLEAGPPCSYAISPTSRNHSSSAASGTVSVTTASSCPWSAVSNVAWVSITAGSSGTGNGTVSYSVAANTSQPARSGTLTIAGQTFTVSQAAGGGSCAAPSIVTQPQSTTISSGQTATLTVSATGTAPLTYQWYRGNSGNTSNPVTGATSTSYTTGALSATTSFWVRVSNACGQANSSTATVTVAGSGSCGSWQPGGAAPVAANYYAVAHGSGKFVAVGSGGALMTSPDGGQWTNRTSGTTGVLSNVVWIGSAFYATGWNGVLLASSDGITWTPRTSGTTKNLYAVASNGTTLVAVGASGTILTSTNGTSWTPRTSPTSLALNGVASNGSGFVAVGVGGTTVVSSDGQTWTKVTPTPIAGLVHRVIWAGTQYVAVGDLGVIATSPNGTTWTTRTSTTPNWITGIAWSGSRFVASGVGGTLLSSIDAVSWTAEASGVTAGLGGVAWGGGRFVSAGDQGTVVWKSCT